MQDRCKPTLSPRVVGVGFGRGWRRIIRRASWIESGHGGMAISSDCSASPGPARVIASETKLPNTLASLVSRGRAVLQSNNLTDLKSVSLSLSHSLSINQSTNQCFRTVTSLRERTD
jgi:hypothetical protein